MTVQSDSERAVEQSPESRDIVAGPEQSTLAWVGPFVVFLAWLALDKYLPVANPAK